MTHCRDVTLDGQRYTCTFEVRRAEPDVGIPSRYVDDLEVTGPSGPVPDSTVAELEALLNEQLGSEGDDFDFED